MPIVRLYTSTFKCELGKSVVKQVILTGSQGTSCMLGCGVHSKAIILSINLIFIAQSQKSKIITSLFLKNTKMV